MTDDPATHVAAVLRREARDVLAYFAWRVDNPDDAADLLSETMVIAWKHVATLPRHDHEARMWLFGVARKVLAGHRRATRRRMELSKRVVAQFATESWSADLAGDPVDHGQQPHDYVRTLLHDLDEVDREIIILHHWSGFTLKEAAQILAMKEPTVRSRYHRAKKALRLTLTDAGELSEE